MYIIRWLNLVRRFKGPFSGYTLVVKNLLGTTPWFTYIYITIFLTSYLILE